jgi:hypothetical protein
MVGDGNDRGTMPRVHFGSPTIVTAAAVSL